MIKKQKQSLKCHIRKFAERLTSFSASKGAVPMRILLCCCLMGGGAASFYLLATGISEKKVHLWDLPGTFPILSYPKQVDTKQPRNKGISPQLLDRILTLKKNDSLFRARPGLIDTIELIEKTYSPSLNK